MWSAFLLFMVFMAPGWWVLTGLYIIWAYILSDKECWQWVIASIVLYLAYTIILSGLNVFEYATKHPFWILIFIGIHFLGGFIWSFPRWWLFVREKAEEARSNKEKWMKEKSPKKPKIKTEHDGNLMQTYELELKNVEEEWHTSCVYDGAPKVKNNINRITTWIIYWEFSIIRSLLQDILVRFWRQIVLRFSKVYQKMSDKAFVGLEKKERV